MSKATQAPFSSTSPNYIGNGRYDQMFTKRLNIRAATAADSLSCLKGSFNQDVIPNGTPAIQAKAGTIAIVGSTGVITLAVKNCDATGSANSDIEFTITMAAAKVDWSAGAASAYSLKDVIDLMNDEDAGGTSGGFLQAFKCWIGDGGMYDLTCNGASQFQDLAETYIMPAGGTASYTSFLKQDLTVVGAATSDSDYMSIWRIGFPEARDRGLFKLLDLYGAIGTDTGGTLALNAGVMVVGDDYDDYVLPVGTWATDIANHKQIPYWVDCANLPSGSGSATNSLNHNASEAAAIQGPVVVLVKANTAFDTQTVALVAQLQAVV